MDVIIRTVYKYWLGPQRASTQLIALPRSHVLGQAALTAMWDSPAWVRIADGRSADWHGEAPFGGQTVLRATTDLVVLQVWADQNAKAAAVGTLFLSSAVPGQHSEIEALPKFHELGTDLFPAEEATWAGYTPEGTITGLHSVVRYQGAAPLRSEEVERVLRESFDAPDEQHFTAVDTTDLLTAGRIRIDPATRRLVVG